jgi:hypothetical protein
MVKKLKLPNDGRFSGELCELAEAPEGWTTHGYPPPGGPLRGVGYGVWAVGRGQRGGARVTSALAKAAVVIAVAALCGFFAWFGWTVSDA